MSEKSKKSYKYQADGYDRSGFKIPAFPILPLALEKAKGKKISGPAIIDTGFDGAVFANEALTLFLEDVPKEDEKIVGGFGAEEFTCELFRVKAQIIDTNRNIIKPLGETLVYVPTDLNYLSDYVIIGRELLNTISFCLDGVETIILS
ncbi:MAG: hypothetical protein ACTSQI_21375 [Candidatus Helarchaeota archaeon]